MPIVEIARSSPIKVRGPVIVNPAGGEKDSNGNTDIFLPEGVDQSAIEALTESADDIVSLRLGRWEPAQNLRVNFSLARSVQIPRGRDVVIHSMGRIGKKNPLGKLCPQG